MLSSVSVAQVLVWLRKLFINHFVYPTGPVLLVLIIIIIILLIFVCNFTVTFIHIANALGIIHSEKCARNNALGIMNWE